MTEIASGKDTGNGFHVVKGSLQSAREREHAGQAFRQARDAQHEGAPEKVGASLSGHEDVASRAYSLWEARGCPQGSPERRATLRRAGDFRSAIHCYDEWTLKPL